MAGILIMKTQHSVAAFLTYFVTTKGRPQSYIPLAAATVGLDPKPLFANLRLSAAG